MDWTSCLPIEIANAVKNHSDIREIRLRNNNPIRLNKAGHWYWCGQAELVRNKKYAELLRVDCDDIVKRACNNSVYAYEKMLSNGFFTLDNGVRFGVAGELVFGVESIFKKYTSVCIRIPHLAHCVNDDIMQKAAQGSMLIIGSPGVGKTTIIRDISIKLSVDSNVVIIDERGEIAVDDWCSGCDVLKWINKKDGVELALRSLSPDYIVLDELSQDDFPLIPRSASSGVKFIVTLHGIDLQQTERLLGDYFHFFSTMIICEGVGKYRIVSLESV